MLEMLRTELHCHNVFSNGHVGDLEPPFDCNVTVNEQLQKALDSKLDVLFVTNHNTLDGFKQMTDYKNSHEKFSNVKVYPAVEITTDKEAHVLVYGLQEEIKSSQSIDEILDAAKSQDAVTIAPHPFSLIDALRDDSLKCDLFEIFNSANIDIYSNKKAEVFAKEHNLLTIAGSDSHVASTIGRCTNLINSENNLDDILYAMKKGKIAIEKMEYVTRREVLEHLQYKIENSKEYIDQVFLPIINDTLISNYDILCTLVEHIAIKISSLLSEYNLSNAFFTGGGALNSYLMGRIKKLSSTKIIIPEMDIINFKEAINCLI